MKVSLLFPIIGRKERIEKELTSALLHINRHPEEKGKADARVKEILAHAADFPEGTRVITHVVYAKAHEIVLQVAKKHVSTVVAFFASFAPLSRTDKDTIILL